MAARLFPPGVELDGSPQRRHRGWIWGFSLQNSLARHPHCFSSRTRTPCCTKRQASLSPGQFELE